MAINNIVGNMQDLQGDGSVILAQWTLTGTDSSAPFPFSSWADKSIQVGTTGDTFNAGTIIVEGSNDGGTSWYQLDNPQGTGLSFTSAGLKQILEITGLIRARASVAVTSVNVYLLVRRQSSLRV